MAKAKAGDQPKFPKNKILEDKRWSEIEYCVLSAVLIDEDEYTVEEAAAKITEYKNSEVN